MREESLFLFEQSAGAFSAFAWVVAWFGRSNIMPTVCSRAADSVDGALACAAARACHSCASCDTSRTPKRRALHGGTRKWLSNGGHESPPGTHQLQSAGRADRAHPCPQRRQQPQAAPPFVQSAYVQTGKLRRKAQLRHGRKGRVQHASDTRLPAVLAAREEARKRSLLLQRLHVRLKNAGKEQKGAVSVSPEHPAPGRPERGTVAYTSAALR